MTEKQTDLDILKRELAKLDDESRKRKLSNGISYYVPNEKQMIAHKWEADTLVYVGGNRSGKSVFGATELVMHTTRQYPDWYPENKKYWFPIKAVISATEFPVVERVIWPKLREYYPEGMCTWKKTSQGNLTKVFVKGGSTVDILTSEMANEAYESADWDFAWLDEPQSQTKFQALQRGLVDRCGRQVLTFTPLTEPWMKEELIDKADGKTIAVIQVDMRDNLQTIGGTEILTEKAISRFEQMIPEDVRATRLHGEFFTIRGRIYKEFCDDHLTTREYEFPDPVICVLDPHDRQPHHVIWAFIDRQDDIVIDYEMIVHCELPELALKILAMEKARGYKTRKRLIDPNFGRKPFKPGANRNVKDELGKHGCSFYEANDNVELGHMLVREMLHFDRKKEVTAVNKPKLFFNRSCLQTIRSVRDLQFEDWKGSSKDEKDPKESQKEYGTHGADCTRYLVCSKPTFRNFRQVSEPLKSFY